MPQIDISKLSTDVETAIDVTSPVIYCAKTALKTLGITFDGKRTLYRFGLEPRTFTFRRKKTVFKAYGLSYMSLVRVANAMAEKEQEPVSTEVKPDTNKLDSLRKEAIKSHISDLVKGYARQQLSTVKTDRDKRLDRYVLETRIAWKMLYMEFKKNHGLDLVELRDQERVQKENKSISTTDIAADRQVLEQLMETAESLFAKAEADTHQ